MKKKKNKYFYQKVILFSSNTSCAAYSQGICGDCNLTPENDCMSPNGECLQNTNEFANSWKVKECYGDEPWCECNEPLSTTLPPVLATTRSPKNCSRICDILLTEEFASCRQIIDFEPYIESCQYDACGGTKLGCYRKFSTSVWYSNN